MATSPLRKARRPRKGASVSSGDRTAAFKREQPEARRAIAGFFRRRGSAIAHEAAALYRQTRKDDRDKVARIFEDLELGDWATIATDMQDRYVAVFEAGGQKALTDLAAKESMFGALNAPAADYAATRGAELVTSIEETTRAALKATIENAFTEGQSPAELAEAIRDSYWFSDARAELIADTELAMAHVSGALEGWRQSGLVQGKSWLVSDDHDVDDECDENETAGVIGVDEDFPSGDDGPPAHPGCNCDVAPELIGEEGGVAEGE